MTYEWVLTVGSKYDPDQPRVPAGEPDGGQWTTSWGGSSMPARPEGRREGWDEKYRKKLWADLCTSSRDILRPWGEIIQDLRTVVDQLSQDEMEDMIRDASADGFTYEMDHRRYENERALLMMISRLDPDRAERMAEELMAAAKPSLDNYDKLSELYNEQRAQHPGWNALTALKYGFSKYAPTNDLRKKVTEWMVDGGVPWYDTSHQKDVWGLSAEDAAARCLDSWLAAGGTEIGDWMNAAVAQVFDHNTDGIEVYWNRNSAGIMLRDPAPEIVGAIRYLYGRTQDYYAGTRRRPYTLYRGTGHEVAVASPVESWSKAKSTGSRFAGKGGHVMIREAVPWKNILMSWEATADLWKPEDELKGKKEVVLITFDFEEPR